MIGKPVCVDSKEISDRLLRSWRENSCSWCC